MNLLKAITSFLLCASVLVCCVLVFCVCFAVMMLRDGLKAIWSSSDRGDKDRELRDHANLVMLKAGRFGS